MERLETRIVPPDGPVDAKVCLIGQAPGKDEDWTGRPFVGAAGQLLDRGLKAAGLLRSQVLVNNLFRQRPPKNDVKYFFKHYPKEYTWEGEEHVEQLRIWLEGLLKRRESEAGGPNVLVALGAEAMYALTGKKRITKWRGSMLPCTLVPGFKVYVSFHPSYVNRLMNEPEERLVGMKKVQKQNALPIFLRDLERVKEQSEFPELRVPKREIVICWEFEQAIGCLEDLDLDEQLTVAVDIETIQTAKGPIVWCIGFAPSPDYAFVVPMLKQGRLYWTAEEEAEIWRRVSRVFLNPKILKVFHFGSFDLSILGRYHQLRVASGTYADTMWCHQATYPYLLKGLDLLTSFYTWEPYYKDDGKYWDGRRISDEAEFLYNGKDCCVTRELWPIVSRVARENHTWKTYQNSISVIPSLLRMMIKGVKLDIDTKAQLSHLFKTEAENNRRLINSEAGITINPGSPAQLQRLLYGLLGLPIQYSHKTKKPTTDKDGINRLRRLKPESKILKAISEFRKFDKLASTYTTMEVEEDGRVRTSYGFVSTFRLNSSQSHFGGGGNLQNIPVRTEEGRAIRKLFVPDPGFIFLASDLEQAESREVAWLAGDFIAIEAFERGDDIHWNNAKRIFGLPEDLGYQPKEEYPAKILGSISKTMKELRDIGKTIVHATNYGMGPMMLQAILIRQEVYLDGKTCKRLLERSLSSSPFLVQWQRHIREEARATRLLTNSFGDRREFRGRFNDSLFRSAYAWIPQSTVGRLLQFAIQDIHAKLSYFEPLLNVHDEVVGQCRRDDLQLAIREIRPLMERTHVVNNKSLTIPCSFKIGESWGELEEVK